MAAASLHKDREPGKQGHGRGHVSIQGELHLEKVHSS